MGCAACITEGQVQQPQESLTKLRGKALAAELALLAPSQLIPQEPFDRYISVVHKYIIKGQEPPDGKDPASGGTSPTDRELLLIKWKLLIYCSGLDLYHPQYDSLDETLQHGCFGQIEKDLDRTFPDQPLFLQESNKQAFQRLLKRLTLYFPGVGYTQGLNFIVGYLMILGYDEHNTFWLVAHLAVHPKYLLLGLFEDGFPLSVVYCRLFRWLFRSRLPKLHGRFEQMALADEIWIFKWFMTYYIYSFPFEIVREVWDAVMVLGGIGLVYFAVALVTHLQPRLIELEDDVEVAAFFSNLKQHQSFVGVVDLQKVLRLVYGIKLEGDQIAEIAHSMNQKESNFYVKFFESYNDPAGKAELVKNWHVKLAESRHSFLEGQKKKQMGSYEEIRFRPKVVRRKDPKFNPKFKPKVSSAIDDQNSRMRMTASIYVQLRGDSPSNPPNNSLVVNRMPTEEKEKEDEVVIFQLDEPDQPSFKKKAEYCESTNTVNAMHKKISRVVTEKNEEPSRKIKRVREHSNYEFSENSSSNREVSESRFEYCVGDGDNIISESVYEFSGELESNPRRIQVENVQ